MLGGCAFSWASKKQVCVALSSTEAEFVALALTVKEAVYLKTLLSKSAVCEMKDPITIHSDNLSAPQTSRNPMHHAASTHFLRKVMKFSVNRSLLFFKLYQRFVQHY